MSLTDSQGTVVQPDSAGNPMSEPERTEEFVRLFTRHARRIYGFIWTLRPNTTDAEEIFQETSTVLWRKFDQFEPGTDFMAWACRIAHYKVLSHRQRVQRDRLQFSEAFVETVAAENIAQAPELDARQRALIECLKKLSERDRDLLERRYFAGATPKLVAQQVGRSVDAIYKALSRIHEALFQCIDRTVSTEGRAG